MSELREMLWSEEITLGVLSTNSVLLLNPWELIWFPQRHAPWMGFLVCEGRKLPFMGLILNESLCFQNLSLKIGFYRVLPYPLDLPKLSSGPSQASDSYQMIKLRHREVKQVVLGFAVLELLKLFILPHWLIEMVFSSRSPVLFVLIEFIWGKWKKSKRRGISKQYLSVIVPTSGGPTTETIIPVSSPAPYWITNPLIFPLKFHKRSKFPVCLLLCFTSTS